MPKISNISSYSYLFQAKKISQFSKSEKKSDLVSILQKSLTKQFGNQPIKYVIDSYDVDKTLITTSSQFKNINNINIFLPIDLPIKGARELILETERAYQNLTAITYHNIVNSMRNPLEIEACFNSTDLLDDSENPLIKHTNLYEESMDKRFIDKFLGESLIKSVQHHFNLNLEEHKQNSLIMHIGDSSHDQSTMSNLSEEGFKTFFIFSEADNKEPSSLLIPQFQKMLSKYTVKELKDMIDKENDEDIILSENTDADNFNNMDTLLDIYTEPEDIPIYISDDLLDILSAKLSMLEAIKLHNLSLSNNSV